MNMASMNTANTPLDYVPVHTDHFKLSLRLHIFGGSRRWGSNFGYFCLGCLLGMRLAFQMIDRITA